jgi:hypothetical protein
MEPQVIETELPPVKRSRRMLGAAVQAAVFVLLWVLLEWISGERHIRPLALCIGGLVYASLIYFASHLLFLGRRAKEPVIVRCLVEPEKSR